MNDDQQALITVTVSGLPQADDHAFVTEMIAAVTEMIAAFLGI